MHTLTHIYIFIGMDNPHIYHHLAWPIVVRSCVAANLHQVVPFDRLGMSLMHMRIKCKEHPCGCHWALEVSVSDAVQLLVGVLAQTVATS